MTLDGFSLWNKCEYSKIRKLRFEYEDQLLEDLINFSCCLKFLYLHAYCIGETKMALPCPAVSFWWLFVTDIHNEIRTYDQTVSRGANRRGGGCFQSEARAIKNLPGLLCSCTLIDKLASICDFVNYFDHQLIIVNYIKMQSCLTDFPRTEVSGYLSIRWRCL